MKKKMLKFITCIIMVLVCITTPLKINAAEKNQYFAAVLYDNSSYRIAFTIYQDDGGKLKAVEKYSSVDAKYFPYRDKDFSSDLIIKEENEYEKNLSKTYLAFPGINVDDTFTVYTTDFDQANSVVGGLVGSLNTAIGYVGRYGVKDGTIIISTSTTLKQVATDIAQTVNTVIGSSVGTRMSIAKNINITTYDGAKTLAESNTQYAKVVNEIDKIINASSGTYRQGIKKDDFVVMSDVNGDGQPIALMVSCPKGYSTGQLYEGERGETYNVGTDRISWKGIVTYANAAASEGLWSDTDGWTEFVSMGSFEKSLSEFASSITSKGAKALGLNTLEELVFNREGRGSTYYLGMMPYTWFQISNSLFWVFQIIAVFTLFASVLYAVYKQNYAVISPSERLSLQDHIANILIAIFLMVLYVPIFYILGKSNQMIVQMFDSMTSARSLTTSFNLGWIVALVVTILNLTILVKLNITYLVRAATITLLHVISPLAIASMSIMGNKRGSLFNTWLREMINAIFIQSFDAIVLALFIMVNSYGGTQSAWEGLMLMFMFIPLNNWFKEKITGTSGIMGVSKDVQSSAGSRVASAVAGIGVIAGTAAKTHQVEEDSKEKNLMKPESSTGAVMGGKRTSSQTVSGGSAGGSYNNTMKEDTLVSSEGEKTETKRNTGSMKADKVVNTLKNGARTAGAVTGVLVGSTIGGSVGNAISGAASKNYNPTAFREDKYEDAFSAVEGQRKAYNDMVSNYNSDIEDKEKEWERRSIEAERNIDNVEKNEERKFEEEERDSWFGKLDRDEQERIIFDEYYNQSIASGESEQDSGVYAAVMSEMEIDYLNSNEGKYKDRVSVVNEHRLDVRKETAVNNYKSKNNDIFNKEGDIISKQQYAENKTQVPDALINKNTGKMHDENSFIKANVKESTIEKHNKYAKKDDSLKGLEVK